MPSAVKGNGSRVIDWAAGANLVGELDAGGVEMQRCRCR
jgi:hypothetical protein